MWQVCDVQCFSCCCCTHCWSRVVASKQPAVCRWCFIQILNTVICVFFPSLMSFKSLAAVCRAGDTCFVNALSLCIVSGRQQTTISWRWTGSFILLDGYLCLIPILHIIRIFRNRCKIQWLEKDKNHCMANTVLFTKNQNSGIREYVWYTDDEMQPMNAIQKSHLVIHMHVFSCTLPRSPQPLSFSIIYFLAENLMHPEITTKDFQVMKTYQQLIMAKSKISKNHPC